MPERLRHTLSTARPWRVSDQVFDRVLHVPSPHTILTNKTPSCITITAYCTDSSLHRWRTNYGKQRLFYCIPPHQPLLRPQVLPQVILYWKVGQVSHRPIDPKSPFPAHCDPKKGCGAKGTLGLGQSCSGAAQGK